MTPRELEEYGALRTTIRERGTTRIWLFCAGLSVWAALVLATAATMSLPVATLLPLLMLAAVFEGVLALHIGVERIGRYLQVFYEADDPSSAPRWEHAAMAFGKHAARGTPDPLFSGFFLLATVWNFVPAVLAGALPVEWLVVGSTHVVFAVRIVTARRHAAGQRAADLARFQELRQQTVGPRP
jgi:hypothetical protein